MQKMDDGVPKTCLSIKKSHATMFPKKFISFYLEDLSFLVKRCCWRVTKIYTHYTFEQPRFKRNFVLMNQKSRQNAKYAIEKDFFKLMNNANFRFYCRNNVNNVTFEPIIDEINEISYIKKYYSPFDTKVSGFINSDLLKQEIEKTFEQRLAEVKYDDLFRNAKITVIENQNKEECNVLEALEKKERESSLKISKQNWRTLSKIKKLKP